MLRPMHITPQPWWFAVAAPPPPAGFVNPPGLVYWLDAADAATISLGVGNAIAQVNDRSGSNNHAAQAVSIRQPTLLAAQINGLPTIHVAGASGAAGQIMNLANPVDYTGGFTLFFVGRCASGFFGPLFAPLQANSDSLVCAYAETNGFLSPEIDTPGPGRYRGGATLAQPRPKSAAHIMWGSWDGVASQSGLTLGIDNESVPDDPEFNYDDTGVVTGGFFQALFGNDVGTGEADYGEIRYFDRVLTDTEKGSVIGNLRGKWGVS